MTCRCGTRLVRSNTTLRASVQPLLVLRTQSIQRTLRSLNHVIVAHKELVGGRDREFELLAITDDVERFIANDRVEPDHAQHAGLANQDVAADFLEVGDFAPLFTPHGSVEIDRSVEALDAGGVAIEAVD